MVTKMPKLWEMLSDKDRLKLQLLMLALGKEGWEPPLSVHIEPIQEIDKIMRQKPRGKHAAYIGGKGSG